MKKKLIAAGMAFSLLFAAFYGGTKVGAADHTPGSAYDPLITQSYLETRLSETQSAGFSRVNLAKNKTLSLEAGGWVLVLTGTADAVGSSGLVDMTEGILLTKGLSVMKYHLCMAAEKGSGITATTACTVYVAGNYQISP